MMVERLPLPPPSPDMLMLAGLLIRALSMMPTVSRRRFTFRSADITADWRRATTSHRRRLRRR
jgi:hypothetical protein